MRFIIFCLFSILTFNCGFCDDSTITWKSAENISFDFSNKYSEIENITISPEVELENIFNETDTDFGLSNNSHLKNLRIDNAWWADHLLNNSYLPKLESLVLKYDFDSCKRHSSRDFINEWTFISNMPSLMRLEIKSWASSFYGTFSDKSKQHLLLALEHNPQIEELLLDCWHPAFMSNELKKGFLNLINLKRLSISFHYNHFYIDYIDDLEYTLKEGLPNTEIIFIKHIEYPQDGGM